MAPKVGLEPTTDRLTADCSTIELLWIPKEHKIYKPPAGASINFAAFSTVRSARCGWHYTRSARFGIFFNHGTRRHFIGIRRKNAQNRRGGAARVFRCAHGQ